MIKFRHKGCRSEVIRYIADKPLEHGSVMNHKDWRYPDGTGLKPLSNLAMTCPDCDKLIRASARFLEPIEVAATPLQLPK